MTTACKGYQARLAVWSIWEFWISVATSFAVYLQNWGTSSTSSNLSHFFTIFLMIGSAKFCKCIHFDKVLSLIRKSKLISDLQSCLQYQINVALNNKIANNLLSLRSLNCIITLFLLCSFQRVVIEPEFSPCLTIWVGKVIPITSARTSWKSTQQGGYGVVRRTITQQAAVVYAGQLTR